MLPLADVCNFTSGSFQTEYSGRLNKWNEAPRAYLMADLEAAFFHLYGIDTDDGACILSTFRGIHEESPLEDGTQLAEFAITCSSKRSTVGTNSATTGGAGGTDARARLTSV